MKPTTPAIDARRFVPVQRLAWLFDLEGPGLALRASTLPLTLEGEDYAPALIEIPLYSMKALGEFSPGGCLATSASVRLADPLPASGGSGISGASLASALLCASASEFTATLRLVWLDESGDPDPADVILLLTGGIRSFTREAGALALDLADPLTLLSGKPVLRGFDALVHAHPADAPLNSDLPGRALPVVFGDFDRLSLPAFELGPATELATPLAIDDDQAFILSLENFPPSGVAQIGEELVQFNAIDTANTALGTPALPLVRLETPVPHPAAELVRARPAAGFTWFVADHPCAAVTDVRAAGQPLPPASFTPVSASFGERDVQLLRLDRVPRGAVTAHVQGWPLPGGALADHPVDVLEILLTDPRFAALDPAALEMASFAHIRDELTAVGAAFARVLDASRLRLGDLIDSAAREMAAWVRSYSTSVTLTRATAFPPLASMASFFPATALDPLATAEVRPEPSPLPSGLLLTRPRPAAPPNEPEGPVASFAPFFFPFEPAPGVANAANPPLRLALDWLDARSAAALLDLARRVAPPLAEARTFARHLTLPAYLLLEPGDAVALTAPPLGLAADPLVVESLATDGPDALRLRLSGPLAGPACFFHPPAPFGDPSAQDPLGSLVPPSLPPTFVRPFAGGRRLLIALEGACAARLAWHGRLSLAGEFVETSALDFTPPYDPDLGPIAVHIRDDPPDDPIARLVLASGDPGAFAPFLLLTADPALSPSGAGHTALASATLVENVPLPPPPAPPVCVLASAGGFTLFPHPSAAALHYDALANELRLAGELTEGVPLDGS